MGGAHAEDLRASCGAASGLLQWPLPFSELALLRSAQENAANERNALLSATAAGAATHPTNHLIAIS